MATVVDFCCKGPGLLSAVPAKHNRIAVIDDGDLRTKIIISKKLPDVKIIERKDVNILKNMKDLNIIMNPPYDGSLHLKILDSVTKTFPEAKIVNLSPIRWLEDPLAEYKKNSDFKRFENIRKHIENVEIIKSIDASSLFNISIYSDLGIYTVTKNGGLDTKNFWKHLKSSMQVKMIEKLMNLKDTVENHIEKNKIDGIRVPLTNIGGNRGYKNVYKDLDFVVDGKKNGKDWTKCKNMGGYEKNEESPLPLSIKFNTETEAENFYKSFFTPFYAWLCNITHSQQNLSPELLPYLDDYTHEWTDEMLYEFFELTEDEIKAIESEVK